MQGEQTNGVWKLWTCNENVRPSTPEAGPFSSHEQALRAACSKMKVAHVVVLYIEGPDGQRTEQDAIKLWCAAQPKDG